MGHDLCTVPIAEGGLLREQCGIVPVRLGGDVDLGELAVSDGHHVIKAEQTEAASVQLHDVLAGLEVFMIRFWRFHRDKVFEAPLKKNNADIGAATVLVILDTVITAVKEAYVLIRYAVDAQ